MRLQTARLILRPWVDGDRDAFAQMLADPAVMVDRPRPNTRAESDLRFNDYRAAFDRHGYTRWALEHRDTGAILGYCGILPLDDKHPLAPGTEIGWRLNRAFWGAGYVTEAAQAALRDGFERCAMPRIWTYTSSINARSEAVMRRLGLTRMAGRDYRWPDGQLGIVYLANGA